MSELQTCKLTGVAPVLLVLTAGEGRKKGAQHSKPYVNNEKEQLHEALKVASRCCTEATSNAFFVFAHGNQTNLTV